MTKRTETAKRMPDMSELEKVLKRFDRREREIQLNLTNAESDEEVQNALDDGLVELTLLQEAFFKATSDRNSHDTCMITGSDFIRQCVETWRREQGPTRAAEAFQKRTLPPL